MLSRRVVRSQLVTAFTKVHERNSFIDRGPIPIHSYSSGASRLNAQAKKVQQTAHPNKDLTDLRSQVTVVIPTLNQAETIGILIDGIKSHGYDNILVVDLSSVDKTKMIAEERGVSVIPQVGQDKAGAVLTAFRSVNTPYLLMMEGDGSYDPADLDKLLPYPDDNDFVKGARARNNNMPILHQFGNFIMSKTFNMLFGTTIDDVCSGMYLLRTEKVASLSLERYPLTVEFEISEQMARSTDKIESVPINYNKRIGGNAGPGSFRQGLEYFIRDFQLAKRYNPLFLFSLVLSLALVPSILLLISGAILALLGRYENGYFLLGAILFVLGVQGITIASVSGMFRKVERKLNSLRTRG